MGHIVLYRSWRPQTFQDVVGQHHIVQTLQNSLKEGRISHAYLFCGPRGTGKTSTAKIMAKAVNCERGKSAEPCNQCPSCVGITDGSIMDVLEIDAASNRGVEEIRDIRDQVKYTPSEVRYKVYIIDEVHMLTTEAFNALLKTLEEPPAHVIFILATTEPHKVPATILSRCQRFDFRRVSLEDLVARLNYICEQEGITAEPEALQLIARLADGGLRDALSLLDQIMAFSGTNVTYDHVVAVTGGIDADQFLRLAKAIQDQDIGAALQCMETLWSEGKSAEKCMESLLQFYRDLLMIKLLPDAREMTDQMVHPESFAELAQQMDNEQIFQIIDTLNHYLAEMKFASQPQTMFEIAVLKICAPPKEPSWQALADRVAQLERQVRELLSKGIGAVQHSTTPTHPVSLSSGNPSASLSPRPSVSQESRRFTEAVRSTTPFQTGTISASQLEAFIQQKDEKLYHQVCTKWSQILSQVKAEKITVHAWLVDGEPVSATSEAILLAFKNEIHCKTTSKPANKQLIEKVIHEQMGQPLQIATIMRSEWNKHEDSSESEQVQEPLHMEPENVPDGKYKEEWINEAIELFGEDLVVIKEDD